MHFEKLSLKWVMGTSPRDGFTTKDPGNERIRIRLKFSQILSSQLWKTKKLEYFYELLFILQKKYSVERNDFDL